MVCSIGLCNMGRAGVGGVTRVAVVCTPSRPHALTPSRPPVGLRVDGRRAVEDDDAVGEVRRHDEVVLHHERRLLRVKNEPADRTDDNHVLSSQQCLDNTCMFFDCFCF